MVNIDIQNIIELINSKRINEAHAELEKILNFTKDNFLLFNIYGIVLLQKNDLKGAIDQFKKAIIINPEFAEGYYNLGTALFRLLDFNSAIIYLKKAIDIKNNYFEAYFNLGECYRNLEFYDESIMSLNQCIKLDPKDFGIYNNLGLVYHKLNSSSDALTNFKKCLIINPDFFQAYNNIGAVYLDNNQLDDAIINFNKCIKIKIDFVDAYNNLGMALHKQKKYSAAVSILEKGILINNKFTNLYANLANSLSSLGKALDAINILEEKFSQNNSSEILPILASNYCNIGDVSKGINYFRESLKLNPKPEIYKSLLFNLNYIEGLDFKEYFEVANKIKNSYKKYDCKINHNKNLKENNNKIKLGFISGDFREHAVGYQIFDVVNYLSNNLDFELYAYYNDLEEDELTNKFKKIFKFWRSIKKMSDSMVIDQIKLDQIQILIDLSGYTEGNRLQVFFNKPAPIQVSWAGYLASSGLKEIDYIIVDEYVAANLDEKNQFTEKLWKLKNTWSVLTPTNNVVLDNIPANNNGYITFGSFNNLKKINNKIIKLWSQILYQCKDSKLVLSTSQFKDKKFTEYFSKFFLDQGVKLEQLVLKEEANRNDLLNFYNTIDISLDTFPYNGGTTSLESIFMCVPVLTKKGNTFLSKCGESINTSIGLEDWIADNDEDYVLKAINFAKDFRKIQEVKSYLINNRNKFKLFDGKDFADQLSNSFKKMLQLT